MCLMSSAHGNLCVFASANKSNHEKLLQDYRLSITIVWTGTVPGTIRSTIFLLKGTKKREKFTNAFWKKHGMTSRFTIIMIDAALM